MVNLNKVIALALVAIAFTKTNAQQTSVSASATADASATIVAPIAIAKSTGGDMKFGNVSVNGTAGTVVLGTDNSRTTTGGVSAASAMGGTPAAASFDVTGEGSYTYAITLPSSVTLTKSGGGSTMVVNTFTSNPSSTGALTSGAQTLKVGGTLNVGANQASGSYTTSTPFTVTVAYN